MEINKFILRFCAVCSQENEDIDMFCPILSQAMVSDIEGLLKEIKQDGKGNFVSCENFIVR